MKKIFITLSAVALILMGCNSSTSDVSVDEQTVELNDESNNSEYVAADVSIVDRILGAWIFEYDMEGTIIEFTLQLNEDGSYSQTTAGSPLKGTWELLEDEFIIVKNEFIKSENGQRWRIVKSTDQELYIDWNVDGGEEKIYEFKRR
jgi:uncharacterized lipoprotein NlpE involved in copper resistance